MPEDERAEFVAPLIVGSVKEAKDRGASLALIRPIQSCFRWKAKSPQVIEAERKRFKESAAQASLLDDELASIEPCPYEFGLRFQDQDGWHAPSCGDWETTATFWKHSNKDSVQAALAHLDNMYNVRYPNRGMVLALGNMASRPQVWLLLGIIRADIPKEPRLFP